MSTSGKKEGKSRSSSRDSIGSDIIRRVMEKVKKKEERAKQVEAANSKDSQVNVEAIASVSNFQDGESWEVSNSDEDWVSEEDMDKAKKKGKGKGKGKGKSSRTGRTKKREAMSEEIEDVSDSEHTFSKAELASHVNYTLANPLGRILMQMVDDNLKMQTKVGINPLTHCIGQNCPSKV